MNRQVLKTYVFCALIVAALFPAIYGLTNWYASTAAVTYNFAFAFEEAIPFIPWTIVLYFSLSALFLMPVFFCSAEQIKRLAQALVLALVIAGIVFVIFPAPIIFSREIPPGFWAPVYSFLFHLDHTTNTLPSLHVAFSYLLTRFVGRRSMQIWYGLICLSVLTTHQHHILDVVAGHALGMLCYWMVHPRLRRAHGPGLAILSVFGLQLLLMASEAPLLLRIVLFTLTAFWAAVANHTHRHRAFTNSDALNRLLNLLLTLMTGAPSTRLHAVHMYNHHRYYKEKDDWSGHHLAGNTRGTLRAVRYLTSSTLRMWGQRKSLRLDPRELRAIKIERACLLLFIVCCLYVWGVTSFALVVLPAWILSWGLLLMANLANHDRCDLNSQANHSRNFLNPIENWLLFNNGYHAVHHLTPGLPWWELPKAHRRLHSSEELRFERNSFFGFLVSEYLGHVSYPVEETHRPLGEQR